MATVDMGSIIKKAQRYLKTDSGKKRISEATEREAYGQIENAGDDFINVFIQEVQSHAVPSGSSVKNGGLGPTAIEALTKVSASVPIEIRNGVYEIGISFTDDLSRESFVPGDRLRNVAALLNNGFPPKASRKAIYGYWHGNRIKGLDERAGTYFINNSIRKFRDGFGGKYNIIGIEVDEDYIHI